MICIFAVICGLFVLFRFAPPRKITIVFLRYPLTLIRSVRRCQGWSRFLGGAEKMAGLHASYSSR